MVNMGFVMPIFAIFASFADAEVGASDSTLVALAVLFETVGLLAVTALGVVSFLLDLGFECEWVAVNDSFDGQLAFLVVLMVRTVTAVAVRPTPLSQREAVAVQLQTLALLAVACHTATRLCGAFVLFIIMNFR